MPSKRPRPYSGYISSSQQLRGLSAKSLLPQAPVQSYRHDRKPEKDQLYAALRATQPERQRIGAKACMPSGASTDPAARGLRPMLSAAMCGCTAASPSADEPRLRTPRRPQAYAAGGRERRACRRFGARMPSISRTSRVINRNFGLAEPELHPSAQVPSPRLTYPLDDRDVLVTACGRICMHRKDQYLDRAGRSAARHQGGRRGHLARQLHELRSRFHRLGAENFAAHRQPVRPEVVTHVLGTKRHPCVRSGHKTAGSPSRTPNLRPSG